MELNTFYFYNQKTGKVRSKGGILGMSALFLFIFVSVAMAFVGISELLCDAFCAIGLDWMFFAMLGMMSIALGTFGSVFNTYTGLYRAKDNEMLLSMPIPATTLLLVRMVGVYVMSLLYSSIVWIPALIVYLTEGHGSVASVVFSVLMTFVIAMLVTVLACLLGWVVALIASRLKNKTVATVLLTLLFLGAYYFVYFRVNTLLQELVQNGEKAAAAIKTWVYPIYQLGLAATGKGLPMLIFTAITAVLFVLCVAVLGRSFIRIATANRGERKTVYHEQKAEVRSLSRALLYRELKHFLGSATYILNCGLGMLLLVAGGVLAVIKADALAQAKQFLVMLWPWVENAVPIAATAALCLIGATNAVSAPSVSLEGKTIWLIQSLPIPAEAALRAKEDFHMAADLPSILIADILLSIALRLDLPAALLLVAVTVLFTWLSGVVGLALGLKMPNLHWTNEVVPIKQGASLTITFFGGWALALVMAVGYYFVRTLNPLIYLAAWAAVLLIADIVIHQWIRKRGAEIFGSLS